MKRILVRSPKDPFHVISPEQALALYPKGVFGRNVGNMIFTESMHRLITVPGVDVVSDSFLSERLPDSTAHAARINAEFDQFVIPLANAFRESFHRNLGQMTQLIERLDIPVVVAGVGVAGGVGSLDNPFPDNPPEVTATIQRFLRAVLDRSATIGVRGETTRDYLAGLGFGDEHVEVVGCPSLFRRGTELRIEKKVDRLTEDSHFTMNLSPYVPLMDEVSIRHAERYRHMTYIPQGHDSLEMLLWGVDRQPQKRPDLPAHTTHPLYLTNRTRFFVDPATWYDYLAKQEFSFGTRIHGNISAINAGTPAHVLAHDARTLELARYHDIPHTLVPDLPAHPDAADLFQQTDYTAFNAGHPERFAKFARFLEKNGVEHVYEEGKSNPAYDERMSTTPFPPGVETLYSESQESRTALVERVAELYRASGQRTLARRHQPVYPFAPEVVEPAAPPKVAPVPTRLRRVAKRVLRRS
ncbi:polysaccharide pyruvyl transferase family protein [Aeromicrobium sp.]|uniref:polysaccharide pyruvyl transferase family protein n=1 Tax=Aeromicrobium sp. TaxID=1871063 RepID=UPI0030C471DC